MVKSNAQNLHFSKTERDPLPYMFDFLTDSPNFQLLTVEAESWRPRFLPSSRRKDRRRIKRLSNFVAFGPESPGTSRCLYTSSDQTVLSILNTDVRISTRHSLFLMTVRRIRIFLNRPQRVCSRLGLLLHQSISR
jgi:hypothetical protein